MRAVAVALAACSVAQPARHTERQTDGRPVAVAGETMEYRVSLRGIVVGHVQVAVGQVGVVDGHPAIVIRARGTSDGLAALIADITWELTTTLDLEHGTVLHDVEEAWASAAGHEEHDRKEHDHGYDILAAAATLRGLSIGSAASLDVEIAGADIPVEIHDAGPDHVPGSGVPAVRLAGIAMNEHAFSVFLSDDAARVPLRLATTTPWGDVDVRLVDYHAPAN